MRNSVNAPISVILILFLGSCTTQKKLTYLNNLPNITGEETFAFKAPDYRIQYRDILYVTVKAMLPDGTINDFLSSSRGYTNPYITQGESGNFIFGYDVNSEGNVILPVIGHIKVTGLTVDEARISLQIAAEKVFKNPTVECKLLSFKFTVIGEVRAPGSYINYNNYLSVFEAIGRAGGIGDYGKRDKVLVIRATENGTKTYRINLQDKRILSSEAYFLSPNDIIVVEPQSQKIFNMNLPIFSFILSSISTSLLLMNYFSK